MLTLTINNTKYSFDNNIIASSLVNNNPSIYGIIFDYKVYGLDHIIDHDGNLSYIYANDSNGKLIYTRTIDFILIYVIKKLWNEKVNIQHSISHGQYITINNHQLNDEDIKTIDDYMQKIIKQELPITHTIVPINQAIDFFRKNDMEETAALLKYRQSKECSIYQLDDCYGYFWGVLLPNTKYITHYQIKRYYDGLWLSINDKPFIYQDKLLTIFKRFEAQAIINNIKNITDINYLIENNSYKELVDYDENRLKQDIDAMVEDFLHYKNKRVILISGPSSSGKTTLTKRIKQHLTKYKMEALTLSLDDFFLDRDHTPLLPDGSFDFENITCIDLDLFNNTINKLLNNIPCYLPTFDFIKGIKFFDNKPTYLNDNQILIIEGLHALNPLATQQIPDIYKYKVYINALTHLNLDNNNYISTSDYRLIRRMSRDIKYRNQSIEATIKQWPKVKAGENKYIYPYQEEADCIINTSMTYEMPIFRTILLPLLTKVEKNHQEYIDAQRIKRFLNFFLPIDASIVPDDSILREFIGS